MCTAAISSDLERPYVAIISYDKQLLVYDVDATAGGLERFPCFNQDIEWQELFSETKLAKPRHFLAFSPGEV